MENRKNIFFGCLMMVLSILTLLYTYSMKFVNQIMYIDFKYTIMLVKYIIPAICILLGVIGITIIIIGEQRKCGHIKEITKNNLLGPLIIFLNIPFILYTNSALFRNQICRLMSFNHWFIFVEYIVPVICILLVGIGITTIIRERRKCETPQEIIKNIEFENTKTGEVKTAPTGFSWTTLFFGFLPALIRGDFKWAFIQFLLNGLTLGISWIVFAFIYNKLYIKDLFNKGFTPFREQDTAYLVNTGVITSNQVAFQINKNHLSEEKRRGVVNQGPTLTVPEQLKEYKELLDSGIITQEEFDKKKVELLK